MLPASFDESGGSSSSVSKPVRSYEMWAPSESSKAFNSSGFAPEKSRHEACSVAPFHETNAVVHVFWSSTSDGFVVGRPTHGS